MDPYAKQRRVDVICEGLMALVFAKHALCMVLINLDDDTLDRLYDVVIAALGKREQGGERT